MTRLQVPKVLPGVCGREMDDKDKEKGRSWDLKQVVRHRDVEMDEENRCHAERLNEEAFDEMRTMMKP